MNKPGRATPRLLMKVDDAESWREERDWRQSPDGVGEYVVVVGELLWRV